ncbi:DUF885 family protein [Deinococcus knuensis]|uniref:DUF885 domain-containing protein n=1 Tax=Deinococcus knuensis TaxID=1837380 RepID=A0ABQ2SXU9_9DEIO|nr:DUF885 family protein [Deinococcus knuensis]GGS43591.1 hypothetical protein GCM10008961_38270 [Deinococcus knuensis]
MTDVHDQARAYLRAHAQLRPVDATFMGLPGHDHQLPPAGPDAVHAELATLEALQADLAHLQVPQTAAGRIDAQLLTAQLTTALAEGRRAPRQHSPAWYTGEAAFGVISLLLPGHLDDPDVTRDALRVRLEAIPAFLAQARAHLQGRARPDDVAERARREARAAAHLLTSGLPRHPLWDDTLRLPAGRAARALQAYAEDLSGPDAPVACGETHLDLLMRVTHALPFGPREALERATEAFARLTTQLETQARRLPGGLHWTEHLARLETQVPDADPARLLGTYRDLHERALDAARPLMTPVDEYGLNFTFLPEWAEGSGDLYFLFYRSPAPLRPGSGSRYWVTPPGPNPADLRAHNCAFVKLVHAVHHGSIGHHTHNARARQADSVLARVAGTDCASGIALLGAGTMVEGWACYAEDLLAEIPGFYTPAEELLLTQFERRNAASCIVDLKLHLGQWTLEQARTFYRDEAHFAPARIWAETTRNTLFPASRLMYWLGTETIKALRAELALPPRLFHDALLAHGHAPATVVADELRAQHTQGALHL